eukprot:TRINITY_DN27657_c0_g1_i1.p1 TRINITY_DN27657_c0_g1~~TRINITY_DN27657_c0_g1_i1.p1  ORF type:complete len:166 (+),score=27.97 TRINITY_DN27657_c0_g1_i1:127-624(+)
MTRLRISSGWAAKRKYWCSLFVLGCVSLGIATLLVYAYAYACLAASAVQRAAAQRAVVVPRADSVTSEPSSHPGISKQVYVHRGQFPYLMQFARSVLAAGSEVPLHSHESMYELFFVVSGTGQVVVNDERTLLEPGSMYAVAPGTAHSMSSVENLTVVYFSWAAH